MRSRFCFAKLRQRCRLTLKSSVLACQPVRLACVKHAASVQSEPESNSPVQICCKDSRWTEIRISKFFPLALHLSMNRAPFRSAREAFLRSPRRLVNFFFRFSENFFSASREAFRHREIRFYENFASPVKKFFDFSATLPRPGVLPEPAKADTTPTPSVRQAFCGKFLRKVFVFSD